MSAFCYTLLMQERCNSCEVNFEMGPEDLVFYKKFGFEPQKPCFDCDQKQRLRYRNARAPYWRKCDATGERVVSIYSPESPYKVYKNDYWNSDQWDALSYGQNFDFNRPFFEQFYELKLKVPRLALSNINPVNSDYCNSCVGNKNCYLVFGGDNNEDTMFGTLCMQNKSVLDADYSNQNELSYMLSDSMNCYGSQFVYNSKSCSNCAFVNDCTGCSECILCTNLVNKSYCIRNEQHSKEEYFAKKKELLAPTFSRQEKNYQEFLELLKNRVVKYAHIVACENCTGGYIKNSKNCHMCFDVSESEDLRNVIFANKCKDCFNCSLLGDNSERCYQVVSTFAGTFCGFVFWVIHSANIEYSDFIMSCRNLFGCVGLKQKRYCIFNKQYSKEDFEALRGKILEHMKKTGEWGKFFPKDHACFGYNETTAFDYYPLSREEALKQGFRWRDEVAKEVRAQTIQVPDNIYDVHDTIVNEVLVCEGCGKNFRIVAQELKFYRQIGIPIPHTCPDCRHRERMRIRNPRKLWQRNCEKCGAQMTSSYSPERPEKVYCEACYLKEVY